MLEKGLWALVVVIAMVVMTNGLWATVHISPTSEALESERRGHLIIIGASVLLAGCAVIAHTVLKAPLWATVAIAAPIVICGGMALTDAAAIFSVVAAYPVVLAGLIGGLFFSRAAG